MLSDLPYNSPRRALLPPSPSLSRSPPTDSWAPSPQSFIGSKRWRGTLLLALFALTAVLLLSGSVVPLPRLSRQTVASDESWHGRELADIELAKLRADSTNTVILFMGNKGYEDLLVNAIYSLEWTGRQQYIIAALDQELYDFCFSKRLPVYKAWTEQDGPGSLKTSSDYDTPGFQSITRKKPLAVKRLVEHGFNVLFLDSDVFFLRDPLPFFTSRLKSSVDMWFQTEAAHEEVMNACKLCSGVYFVKSNAKTIKVFQEVEDLFIANPDVVALRDQAAFTEVFCAGSIGTDEAVSVSGAKMALLSKAEWPNGLNTPWQKAQFPSSPIARNPYLVHNNWVIGHSNKLNRFTKAGMIAFTERTLDRRPDPRLALRSKSKSQAPTT